MGGLKSIVFTTLLAAACGVGVVAVVAHYVEPGGSLFGASDPPVQLTPDTPMQRAGGVVALTNGCVVKQASLPLADGVILEAFVVLGPRAAASVGSAEHRILVATYDFRLHGFGLQSAQLWGSVPVDDRGRRGTGVEFDVHLAGRSAATLLGASTEVAAPYVEAHKSPFYSANLDPRSGLSWGEVANEADLVLTVSQEP